MFAASRHAVEYHPSTVFDNVSRPSQQAQNLCKCSRHTEDTDTEGRNTSLLNSRLSRDMLRGMASIAHTRVDLLAGEEASTGSKAPQQAATGQPLAPAPPAPPANKPGRM